MSNEPRRQSARTSLKAKWPEVVIAVITVLGSLGTAYITASQTAKTQTTNTINSGEAKIGELNRQADAVREDLKTARATPLPITSQRSGRMPSTSHNQPIATAM